MKLKIWDYHRETEAEAMKVETEEGDLEKAATFLLEFYREQGLPYPKILAYRIGKSSALKLQSLADGNTDVPVARASKGLGTSRVQAL